MSFLECPITSGVLEIGLGLPTLGLFFVAGIPEEDQARVFEPFSSTRLMDGGSGLGLDIAHGILNEHGGQVRVDRPPGRGTTITIDCPLGGVDHHDRLAVPMSTWRDGRQHG